MMPPFGDEDIMRLARWFDQMRDAAQRPAALGRLTEAGEKLVREAQTKISEATSIIRVALEDHIEYARECELRHPRLT